MDLVTATCRAIIAKPMNVRTIISLLCLVNTVLAQELQPEFVLQNGHSGGVNAVAFSPDGKTLASGSVDNTIKLCEVASGKVLRTFMGHSVSVSSVAFSPDGMTLVSGSWDKTIKLWEVASGKLLRTFEGHSFQVMAVTFSPDGKTLASGSWDHTIKLWGTASGKLLRTYKGDSSCVSSVAFSPDGKTLASGSWNNTIKLWEVASGKLLRTLDGHSNWVTAVAFSPDGKMLASGSWDDTIKLWDMVSGELLRVIFNGKSFVFSVAFSPDGKTLAFGSEDKTIKLWEVTSGTLLRILEGHSARVIAVAFSPDGKTLASGSEDKTIKLWEMTSRKLLRTIESHSSMVMGVAFSPDGKTLVSGSIDNTIKLWETASGKLLHALDGDSSFALAFSPDGKTLASGGLDKTIKLWETASGKLLRTLEGHSSWVMVVAFSPDGKTLASVGEEDKTIRLWETVSGKLLCVLEGDTSNALAFSPDGKILATAGFDKTIKLWETDSGKLLRTIEGHSSSVFAVAFSPDGMTLASGGNDKTIKLWETASGKLFRTIEGHWNEVGYVAFSPDGKTLTSLSEGISIKTWEAATGNLLLTFEDSLSIKALMALSPDGKAFASGNFDGSVNFWRTQNGKLLAKMYAIDKNDYFIYSPQGYFAASKNAERFAAWRIGNEVYTFDQYGEQLNRPDLIARILAGEEVPPPNIRLATDLPPQLVWVNPISSTSTQQVEIVLQYKGTSGLADLICVLNTEPIAIKPPTGSRETEIRIPLQLTTYDNSLRILAYDEKRLKSDWQRIDFQYENGQKGGRNVRETVERKPQLGDYGKRYAIVIGISDYKHLQKTAANENDLMDLQFAHKDAQDFVAFLQDSTRSGGGWEIHRFINAEATAPQIDRALTGILSNANSRDLIFVFFSGHARPHPLRKGDVYLLTYEFDPAVERDGYDYSVLMKLIADTKAEHVIAFIDACYSGTIGFAKGDRKKQPLVDAEAFVKRLEQFGKNQVIFSSASSGELSHEDPNLKQSVFTHFLLKGLAGEAADVKDSKYIDLGELYKYVRENVSAYVQKRFRASQLPVLQEKSGAWDESFPVAIRVNNSAIRKKQ